LTPDGNRVSEPNVDANLPANWAQNRLPTLESVADVWVPSWGNPAVTKRKKDPYLFFLRSLLRLTDRYERQFVAVVGRSVVAHGRDAERVYEKARKMRLDERISIRQVPVKEAMVLRRVCFEY